MRSGDPDKTSAQTSRRRIRVSQSSDGLLMRSGLPYKTSGQTGKQISASDTRSGHHYTRSHSRGKRGLGPTSASPSLRSTLASNGHRHPRPHR